MRRVLAIALTLAACKAREPAKGDRMPAPAPGDAAGADDGSEARADAAVRWPALADLPSTQPVRVLSLPMRSDMPRFNVGGPVIAQDVAVVSSSQLGFAAIDWRRGALVWTKPAGLHVAPPVAHRDTVVLVGDCFNPPDLPDPADLLLGCVRVVTASGTDRSYTAIRGKRVEPGRANRADPRTREALEAFAAEPGPQQLWPEGERAVRWRRGTRAVVVDVVTGVATPAAPEPPPLRVAYKGRTWDIAHVVRTERSREEDPLEHGPHPGRIVAHERGKLAWQTQYTYTALLGAVYLDEQSPMVRVANVGAFGGRAEMNLLDIDATGSLHGQAAFPVPAIGLLGHAVDAVGNTAIAVRMDSSLRRDFVVGYAANALMMYVYPLPEVPRADPVGVAIAPDAVLVFHDGDAFTVLPELSAPPTAPGTPRAPSQNPTP